MKRLLSLLVLLPIAGVLTCVALGQDQKTDDRPAKKATPEDYKRLATMYPPVYRGKVSATAKSITFHVDDGEYRKQLKKAASLPKPAEQKAEMANVERQFAKIKWALGKEFELELSEKAVLRKQKVEFEYDDKGNPKKLPTVGSDGLYPAKIEDVGDHPTTVYFGAMKNGKPTATKLIVDNK